MAQIAVEAQRRFDEHLIADPELEDLLNEWDDTAEATRIYAKALAGIKRKAAAWEPGRYRSGGYIINVGVKKTVKIERPE